MAHYDNTFAYNADRIKPEKLELFEDTFMGLSKEGLKLYWKDVDGIVKLIDSNRATPLKQIKAREQETLQRECEEYERRRDSASISSRHRDDHHHSHNSHSSDKLRYTWKQRLMCHEISETQNSHSLKQRH